MRQLPVLIVANRCAPAWTPPCSMGPGDPALSIKGQLRPPRDCLSTISSDRNAAMVVPTKMLRWQPRLLRFVLSINSENVQARRCPYFVDHWGDTDWLLPRSVGGRSLSQSAIRRQDHDCGGLGLRACQWAGAKLPEHRRSARGAAARTLFTAYALASGLFYVARGANNFAARDVARLKIHQSLPATGRLV